MHADKKAEYDVKVSEVKISPDPIAKGQPATFNISASAGSITVSYVCLFVQLYFPGIC